MYNIRNNAFQGIFKMSADDDQNLAKQNKKFSLIPSIQSNTSVMSITHNSFHPSINSIFQISQQEIWFSNLKNCDKSNATRRNN